MDQFLKLDTSLEEGEVIKFEDEEILPFSADAKNQQDTLSQQKRKKDTKAALALLEELVREKDSLRIGLKKILQRVDLFSEKLESFQQVIVDLSTFEDSTCASTSNNLAAPEHSAPLLDPLASCTVETSSQDGASDREVHSRGNPSSSKRTRQSVGSRRKRIRRSISPSNSLDGVATNSTEDEVSSLDQHHDSSPFPFVDVVEEKYSASEIFKQGGDKSAGESVACDDGLTEIADQLSIHEQPDDTSAPFQYQREKRHLARNEGTLSKGNRGLEREVSLRFGGLDSPSRLKTPFQILEDEEAFSDHCSESQTSAFKMKRQHSLPEFVGKLPKTEISKRNTRKNVRQPTFTNDTNETLGADAVPRRCEGGPSTALPECWNAKQYEHFKRKYDGLIVRSKKLGCQHCAKFYPASLNTDGIQVSVEWARCAVEASGKNKTVKQATLRKKMNTHFSSKGHGLCSGDLRKFREKILAH